MALSNPKPRWSYLVSLCVTGMSGLVFIQVTTSWLHEPGELSTAASLGSCQEKDNLGTAKARQIPQAGGPQKKSTGDSCGPSSRALRSLKCYPLQKEAPRCGPGFAVYELCSWANGVVSVVFMMRADVELLCQRFPCQLTQTAFSSLGSSETHETLPLALGLLPLLLPHQPLTSLLLDWQSLG